MPRKAGERQPFTGTPLQELSFLLSRLEDRISAARNAYREQSVKPPEKESLIRRSRFSFGLRKPTKAEDEETENKGVVWDSGDGGFSSPSGRVGSEPRAKFIAFADEEQFVEDLRRVAELVVVGENYVTNLQKKQQKKWEREKEAWSTNRDLLLKLSEDDDEDLEEEQKDNAESQRMEAYMELFDHFFERNALDTIVSMLTGLSFDFSNEVRQNSAIEQAPPSGNTDISVESEEDDSETAATRLAKAVKADGTLLPPLSVATQAVQSLAILIQNVSRATSMYVILSNNYVNKLINFPLDLYSAAETRKIKKASDGSVARTFASPELAELTTNFVTFLKSLAMRMNAETLQFFLKYPTESAGIRRAVPASSSHFSQEKESHSIDDGDLPSLSPAGSPRKGSEQLREDLRGLKVEFPLYDRALEFCGAHQDSFVRLTAMNICLNTLRLATVSFIDSEGSPAGKGASPPEKKATPDGNLHASKGLPFREQIAIARYTCAPSRVERLIAPMFTKLAERWNSMEEQIREIDSNKGGSTAEGARNEKVAMAKERVRRERLIRGFKDRAADLQDELLLLEDVFSVGLTVLNEQVIEMMLATFVYPLLLQPLLLYHQRLTPLLETYGSQSPSDHPFQQFGDFEDVEYNLTTVSGPAKAALFTLASVFQFLTNQSLLRLLFTALFHPLSPDSSSVPTVRSALEEATVGADGRATLRLDGPTSQFGLIPDSRLTYAFGKHSKFRRKDASDEQGDDEECVFVLSPALAEVLEFRGKDISLIARARPNPYRRALLNFLDIPHEITGVRELSSCTIDAALSVFDGKFLADILFGTDLKTFGDDMPADERNLDSAFAHDDDDRGMGGSAVYNSRHSAGRQKGGSVGSDLTGDVINALCASIVSASKSTSSPWKLEFDDVAAHALLCCIRKNERAMVTATKALDKRRRQIASFIVDRPCTIHSPMGGSDIEMKGSPNVNASDYEEQMFGSIMELFFFDSPSSITEPPPVEDFLRLKLSAEDSSKRECSLAVATQYDVDVMCARVGKSLLAELDFSAGSFEVQELQLTRTSTRSLLKVDALLTLSRNLASTGGETFQDTVFAGIAISPNGVLTDMKSSGIRELSRQIVCPISTDMYDALFPEPPSLPAPGSVIQLAGSTAIPCVCETPASAAHLFASEEASVVAEGVTWQSLYVVFLADCLILAQPVQGMGAEGRVIAASPLEQLDVSFDKAPPVNNGSPARRLVLSHKGLDLMPPNLFLFDELPKEKEYGPFFHNETFRSSLDVWFEHQNASALAYNLISTQIFKAKSQRGRQLRIFLSPHS